MFLATSYSCSWVALFFSLGFKPLSASHRLERLEKRHCQEELYCLCQLQRQQLSAAHALYSGMVNSWQNQDWTQFCSQASALFSLYLNPPSDPGHQGSVLSQPIDLLSLWVPLSAVGLSRVLGPQTVTPQTAQRTGYLGEFLLRPGQSMCRSWFSTPVSVTLVGPCWFLVSFLDLIMHMK